MRRVRGEGRGAGLGQRAAGGIDVTAEVAVEGVAGVVEGARGVRQRFAVALDRPREALRNAPIHLYDADHAFNRDIGDHFDPASAALAWTRTLDFLADALK